MKNDNKPAIEIKGLRKRYRMGQIGGGTLTADLQSWWARVRKKEDPNIPIGMDVRLLGKTFWALNGIDLTINKGETIGIIGENGAGKSTLLKILSRITAPTEGEAIVRGRIACMLEVGTGFNGEMTGRENVYMNGAILGMSHAEVDEKMQSIIDFSECGDFIDTPVKRYSSGMYVKLAFSVAAHLDSDIMIMDEVLAVGDAQFQKKCLTKMSEAASEYGKTVLYVSHNMETIRQLCGRVIVLKGGKVVFDGATEEGILAYLEEQVLTSKTHYEVDSVKRPGNFGREARVLSLDIKNLHELNTRNRLVFTIEWVAKKRFDELYLRMEVRLLSNVVIGAAESEAFCSTAVGVPQKTTFSLDIENLAIDNYSFYLRIYSKSKGGGVIDYDKPMIQIPFSVNQQPLSRMIWNKRWHGNVCLNTIKVLENGDTDKNSGETGAQSDNENPVS